MEPLLELVALEHPGVCVWGGGRGLGRGRQGEEWLLGPVVRRLISTNPVLISNPGFFFFHWKAFSPIIFLVFVMHPVIKLQTKRIKQHLLFNLSYLNSNFALTLG